MPQCHWPSALTGGDVDQHSNPSPQSYRLSNGWGAWFSATPCQPHWEALGGTGGALPHEAVIENPAINSAFEEPKKHFGFAFDPYAGEEAKQWGNLTILITRMNPDLAIDAPSTGKIAVKVINHYGDEVLKVYDTAPAIGRLNG